MKRLVVVTIFVVCALFSVLILISRFYPNEITYQEKEVPVFGSKQAPIEMVLFEDFQCAHCQKFLKETYPQIHRHYINKEQVRFVFLPIATFPGSDILANAVLCVYRHVPDRLFSFIYRMIDRFTGREIHQEEVASFTKDWLSDYGNDFVVCLDSQVFFHILEENEKAARKIMKTSIRTPALYLNGYPIPVGSFDEIRFYIERALGGL